jgi:6-phosphogluconolactonase
MRETDVGVDVRPLAAGASQWVVLPDLEAVSRAAAARFVELAQLHDRFSVALAGGSTPRRLYEMLARAPFKDQVQWDRVHFFWGDERCVPCDHADSNYRMAREALLDHVPITPGHVHRIRGELTPDQAADAYQAQLESELGADVRLDLVLLGMGADGHTASLFPGASALAESLRRVLAVYVESLRSWRVTLTLPMLNAARQVVFMVGGAAKAETLARVRAGECLPAALVRPPQGHLTWLMDREAAGHIQG